MPNKYEREIEEILRNLERTEPRAGFGRKSGGRKRHTADARRSMPVLHLSFSEWCLVIAFVIALCAGGWEYAQAEGNVITGILALIGFACLVIVAIAPFALRPGYSSSSRRYNNVTPFRRGNPFGRLGTRWNLLMLKLRYRRRKDQEE